MKKLILLALPLLMFSCSSDSDSTTPVNTSGVVYVRGSIDGTAFDYTFNNTATDVYTNSTASGFSGDGTDRWYYYAGGITAFNPPTFAPSFLIGWNNMFFGAGGNETGETDAFYTSVATLPTNYLTSAQDDSHMAGLDIQLEAENGTVYSSKDGSQAGSTFTITGSSQSMISGLQTKTVWGTFNCKLYNFADPTDVVTVTNGTYKVILSEFN